MEPSAANVEQQIQAQIEELRGKFPQTQELYREACILLFFRHGITPTANKLYQYVRKGSMSAPAEALNKFWADLRDRSRARIEHPDLPEEVKGAAGELAASLWTQAQQLAHASLASLHSESQAQVAAARAAEDAARERLEVVSADLAQTRRLLETADEQIRSIGQALAAETATRIAIDQQLQVAREATAAAQQATEEARREFAAELEKLRAAAQLSEERYQAAEQRALLEIDRERTATAKLRKELDQVRVEAGEAAERHRAEISTLQSELGQLRQRGGVLEGSLQAALSERDRAAAQTEDLRSQLTDALGKVAGLRVEGDGWRGRAEEAQQALVELQAKAAWRSRKGAGGTQEGKLL